MQTISIVQVSDLMILARSVDLNVVDTVALPMGLAEMYRSGAQGREYKNQLAQGSILIMTLMKR